MKKYGTMSIVLALILALTATAFSEPSSWAKAEIEQARANNLIVAEAERDYQSFITRELFCKLIVRMIETQYGQPIDLLIVNPFVDTTSSEVVKANQLGIVKGISATQFAPDNLITRQEVAVMMMRAFRVLDNINNTGYAENVNVSGITFNDQAAIANWAMKDVKEAFVLNILKGVGGNSVNPLGNTTIEQSILLSLRLFNRYGATAAAQTTPQSTAVQQGGNGQQTTTANAPTETTTQQAGNLQQTTQQTGNLQQTSAWQGGNLQQTTTRQGGNLQQTTTAQVATTAETSLNFNFDAQLVPSGINRPPVAKAEALTVNLGHSELLILHAYQIANDFESDDLKFISFERINDVNQGRPLLVTSLTPEGLIFMQHDWRGAGEITKPAKYKAIVSDGENETAITFEVNVYSPEVFEQVMARVEPVIINVEAGEYKEVNLDTLFALRPSGPNISEYVQLIEPSGQTEFGKLTVRPKQVKDENGHNIDVLYLCFQAESSTSLSETAQEYTLEFDFSQFAESGSFSQETREAKVVVKYGMNTYKNGKIDFNPNFGSPLIPSP